MMWVLVTLAALVIAGLPIAVVEFLEWRRWRKNPPGGGIAPW